MSNENENESKPRLSLIQKLKKFFFGGTLRKNMIFFSLIFIYEEICLHVCIYKSLSVDIIYPILFAIVLASIVNWISTYLSRTAGSIIIIALTIYTEIQVIYHAAFGNFMPLSNMTMGEGAVTNFTDQIIYTISGNIPSVILLMVPIIVVILSHFFWKTGKLKLNKKGTLKCVGLTCLSIGVIVVMMLTGKGIPLSAYEIYTSPDASTDTSYRYLGEIATLHQEILYSTTGFTLKNTDLNEVSMNQTETPSQYSSDEYNVDESIDFQALADSTDDKTLKALDEYFATVTPTKKNQYTGLLKGYNVITICAESFSPYFISEELTPTLYEMMHTGIIFNNYYGTFQSVTTNGEYTMNMGLYPDMSRTKTESSFDMTVGNYLPFCLGNEMGSLGYKTMAYHNYIGEFYNRNITHPNMGYTFKSADSGLKVELNWPSSDLEMMESSVGDYLDGSDTPFCSYYMTFSGHYQYNWDNAMSAKNRSKVLGLNYSEPVKAYIACNLELEYAMEYLVQQLKDAGEFDHTVIVLTNDHYPYGLSLDQYEELAGQEIDPVYEKYRNAFICYVPGLEENIETDTYCSTADILPTMLNLLGVDYDSRLLAGTDVFADNGVHMAVLSDKSFITDDFRFNGSTGDITYTSGDAALETGSDEDNEMYDTVMDYMKLVENKFNFSKQILNSNYYSHVYGRGAVYDAEEELVDFEDIHSIYYQASTMYMYRSGYVDPEGENYFGGRKDASIGEFCDVLYRMAGKPNIGGLSLPEDFDQDELIDSGYYDAVCWAYENGLLKAEDGIDDSTHQIDYKTAALLIYRYAQLVGLDTSVSVLQEESYMNQYPDLPQETVDALIWVSSQDITTRDCTLAKLFENADSGLTRSQMVLFLFYLDTNCLS
jgi:lipoteichoic acid synthase